MKNNTAMKQGLLASSQLSSAAFGSLDLTPSPAPSPVRSNYDGYGGHPLTLMIRHFLIPDPEGSPQTPIEKLWAMGLSAQLMRTCRWFRDTEEVVSPFNRAFKYALKSFKSEYLNTIAGYSEKSHAGVRKCGYTVRERLSYLVFMLKPSLDLAVAAQSNSETCLPLPAVDTSVESVTELFDSADLDNKKRVISLVMIVMVTNSKEWLEAVKLEKKSIKAYPMFCRSTSGDPGMYMCHSGLCHFAFIACFIVSLIAAFALIMMCASGTLPLSEKWWIGIPEYGAWIASPAIIGSIAFCSVYVCGIPVKRFMRLLESRRHQKSMAELRGEHGNNGHLFSILNRNKPLVRDQPAIAVDCDSPNERDSGVDRSEEYIDLESGLGGLSSRAAAVG